MPGCSHAEPRRPVGGVAALLEVLDPEQNTRFRDVYLDVPLNPSEVLFIATANDLAGIPAPCGTSSRCLRRPGYTDEEKVDISRRSLWREQLEVNGLNAGGFWTQVVRHWAEPEAAFGAAPVRRRVEVLDGETAAVTRPEAAPAVDPPRRRCRDRSR